MLRFDGLDLYLTKVGYPEIHIGNMIDGDVIEEGFFTIGDESLAFVNYPELKAKWYEIYPDGIKPHAPSKPIPTENDQLKAELMNCYQTISELLDVVVLKEE